MTLGQLHKNITEFLSQHPEAKQLPVVIYGGMYAMDKFLKDGEVKLGWMDGSDFVEYEHEDIDYKTEVCINVYELAEEEGETGLTAQEEAYLCERVRAIGEKISKEEPAFTLRAIVEKYYEFE